MFQPHVRGLLIANLLLLTRDRTILGPAGCSMLSPYRVNQPTSCRNVHSRKEGELHQSGCLFLFPTTTNLFLGFPNTKIAFQHPSVSFHGSSRTAILGSHSEPLHPPPHPPPPTHPTPTPPPIHPQPPPHPSGKPKSLFPRRRAAGPLRRRAAEFLAAEVEATSTPPVPPNFWVQNPGACTVHSRVRNFGGKPLSKNRCAQGPEIQIHVP